MGAVADYTIADGNRSMDIFLTEFGLVVAAKAKGGTFFLKIKTKPGAVRVVTASTFSVGNRCMDRMFKHHVSFFFVTSQTQFALVI